MLERLLAHSFIASDVLQLGCYYLTEITNSKGGFISVRTLDYFDVVIGSIREKRIGRVNNEHINMTDIEKINNSDSNLVNIKNVAFIKTSIGWYVGLDSPMKNLKTKEMFTAAELTNIVNDTIKRIYPVFNHCIKQENLPNNNRDFLTGTLSRAAFFQDIKSFFQTMLARKEFSLWLFYMDFNNFKAVNDALGHDMGDQVLRAISAEIRAVFSGYGTLYRLGGDEFVGLCFGVDDEVVWRIKQRIETVTRQAPCGLFVNVAVSVEKFSADKLSDLSDVDKQIEQFIQKCENGMYVAKYYSKQSNSIDCSKCKFFPK